MKLIAYCCEKLTIHDRRFIGLLALNYAVELIELSNPKSFIDIDSSQEYFALFISPTSLNYENLPIRAHRKILISMGYDLNDHAQHDIYRKVMFKNFSVANLVVVDNPVLVNKVVKDFGYNGPVFYMPYGCQIQNFKELTSPNKNVLGTNRLMSAIHNNSMVVEAIALLQPTSYEKFVLVKHGPESQEFLLKHENLLKHIALELMVGGSEEVTRKFLSMIDVYISSSRSDGSSVSMLEAMAAGKICIVTDNETNRYWIKDGVNGFCFKYDSYALSRKIEEVLNYSDEEKKVIKLNAQNRVKDEANWDKNSARFIELIQSL